MKQGMLFLTGAGVGAALMYAMDPASGSRRRGRIRHGVSRAARNVVRDTASMGHAYESEETEHAPREGWAEPDYSGVWDSRSEERDEIRYTGSRVGEMDDREATGSRERGYAAEGERDFGGSGGRTRHGRSPGGLEMDRRQRVPGRRERSAGERILLGAAGSALLAYGLRRRVPISSTIGTVGLGLIANAFTNRDIKEALGIGTGRRGIILDRTIIVNAPREHVFREWSRYENFPRFMSHIREVQDLGDGRSRWVVDGPAGLPVTWDAAITRREENETLAWKSEESPVRNAGIVHFEPLARGGTRVRIRFSYNPPAGFLGHLAAKLGGADPELALDEDLARFKAWIEQRAIGATRDEGAGQGATTSFTPGATSQGL